MAVAQSAQLLERDDYLAELAEIVAQSAHGSGRFVIVEGPAGIGKTRLLQALGAGCEPASTTVLTARGRRWLRSHRRGGHRGTGFATELRRPPLRIGHRATQSLP